MKRAPRRAPPPETASPAADKRVSPMGSRRGARAKDGPVAPSCRLSAVIAGGDLAVLKPLFETLRGDDRNHVPQFVGGALRRRTVCFLLVVRGTELVHLLMAARDEQIHQLGGLLALLFLALRFERLEHLRHARAK